MTRTLGTAILFAALILPACGGGGNTTTGQTELTGTPLLVTAGVTTLDPSVSVGAAAGPAALARLGVQETDTVYDLTTPAGAPFRFDVSVRGAGSLGDAEVSIAHAEDDGRAPFGDADTLREVGIVPFAGQIVANGPWLEVEGEGLARCAIQGTIDRDQSLLVESRLDGGKAVLTLIRLRIGAASAINDSAREDDEGPAADYDGIEFERTIFSSDVWHVCYPAAAQSGDKTTVVLYEGSGGGIGPFFPQNGNTKLNERRLQYARATDTMTGSAPVGVGTENGVFRDHEVAALFNTLGVARASHKGVKLDLSFDRGATFGQTIDFPVPGDQSFAQPIVQIAMAADYRIALAFWRITATEQTDGDPGENENGDESDGNARGGPAGFHSLFFKSELILVEGTPNAVDGEGAPTSYSFDAPHVVYSEDRDLAPTLMGLATNDDGDLVLGYGFTRFSFNEEDFTFTADTEYRAAARIGDDGAFTDRLVHGEEMTAVDPNVEILGFGETLRIFYAAESSDGIRLFTSEDGGATYELKTLVEWAGAHMPTVSVRPQDDALRVDLLYLAPTGDGLELRLRHWDDFDAEDGEPEDATLVEASIEEEDGTESNNGLGSLARLTIRQVGDHGYDTARDGDDLVVIVHKLTIRTAEIFEQFPFDIEPGDNLNGQPGGRGNENFLFGLAQAATPPTPAAGLTDDVPEPNPDHQHQLCLLILD